MRDAVEVLEIERQRHRQRHALGRHVEIIRQRVADDLGLLKNLLGHEMAMVALVDAHNRSLRFQHVALHEGAVGVVDLGAVAPDDHPVAVLEIAHRVGERRQRNRIGADEHGARRPAPKPMASGEPLRAPISRLSSPANRKASAKAPRSRGKRRA